MAVQKIEVICGNCDKQFIIASLEENFNTSTICCPFCAEYNDFDSDEE